MAEHSENSSQEKQTTGWANDEVQRDYNDPKISDKI